MAVTASLLVQIKVLIEELTAKTDNSIKVQRNRDYAVLWNNTYAHCHCDEQGPTLGTPREPKPRFVLHPEARDFPSSVNTSFERLIQIKPSIAFGPKACKDKDAVAKHWSVLAAGEPKKVDAASDASASKQKPSEVAKPEVVPMFDEDDFNGDYFNHEPDD